MLSLKFCLILEPIITIEEKRIHLLFGEQRAIMALGEMNALSYLMGEKAKKLMKIMEMQLSL